MESRAKPASINQRALLYTVCLGPIHKWHLGFVFSHFHLLKPKLYKLIFVLSCNFVIVTPLWKKTYLPIHTTYYQCPKSINNHNANEKKTLDKSKHRDACYFLWVIYEQTLKIYLCQIWNSNQNNRGYSPQLEKWSFWHHEESCFGIWIVFL